MKPMVAHRSVWLFSASLVSASSAVAFAHRIEHRVSLKGRSLDAVAASKRHKSLFPKDASEVVRNLGAIARALRGWYERQADRRARRFRFPKTTPWTPAKTACPAAAPAQPAPRNLAPRTEAAASASPGPSVERSNGRAVNDPGWSHATWKAIGFQPTAPHHFQYRVVAVGAGAEASFSIQARADRDCNGRMALYRLSGHARGDALRLPLLRVRHANE